MLDDRSWSNVPMDFIRNTCLISTSFHVLNSRDSSASLENKIIILNNYYIKFTLTQMNIFIRFLIQTFNLDSIFTFTSKLSDTANMMKLKNNVTSLQARIIISVANPDVVLRRSHDVVQKQTWQQEAVKLFAWQIQRGF